MKNVEEEIFWDIYKLAQKYSLSPFEAISLWIFEGIVNMILIRTKQRLGDKFPVFLKDLSAIVSSPLTEEELNHYLRRIDLVEKTVKNLEKTKQEFVKTLKKIKKSSKSSR